MLLAARYVLPIASPHIEDGAVLVRGDRVVEVGPRAELIERYPEEELRDYGLAAIMPGLVDLHTHLEYSVFRGLVDDVSYSRWKLQVLDKERILGPQDWEDSAVLGAMEAISSGITTIADITASGASCRAADAAGLRANAYREVFTMDKTRIGEVLAAADEDMTAWRGSSDPERITVGIAPHAPYTCHPELFRAVAEKAGVEGIQVATHLAGSRDEYDFIKYGSSPLAIDLPSAAGMSADAWLPTGVSPVRYVLQWGLLKVPNLLAVHCVQVDASDIDVLAANDVAVAYCPRCSAKLGMGIAPLKDFMAAGLRLGIGTDSPASNNTIDFFDEMRIGLLLQRGMSGDVEAFTARRFMRMATVWGAKALGLERLIGALLPGMAADAIAVDLSSSHQLPTQDPYGALVHTANQENVLMTMVAGRILFERGEYATVDAEATAVKVGRIREKLRA